jgi:arylsulfatase
VDRPNIVFIMPDQLRHDFLGCYGADFIDTPHIDALAERGVRYTNAYSAHPVCVPARASLLCGMDAIKTGVLDNGNYLRPDYQQCGLNTWPELLNARGYYTLATGKMHFYPWEKRFGFKQRLIAEDKLWGFIEDDYYHFLKARGLSKRSFVDEPSYHKNHMALKSPLPWDASCDHWVGARTAEWIEAYDGADPFAVMVGFPGPHSPYDPAAEYATFAPEDMPAPIPAVTADNALMRAPSPKRDQTSAPPKPGRRTWYAVDNPEPPTESTYRYMRACYAGLVAQIDVEVGRIVAALERSGQLDNTVIVFSSDHGDYLGDHGLGGKGTFYEGSCHVPMIVSHPGMGKGAVCDDLVTLTDVTATLLALGGAQVPAYMDSRPLPGIGLDAGGGDKRDGIFGYLRSGAMFFDGRWKLTRYPGGAQLYDLVDDPQEQRNRIADAQCAPVRQRLENALWRRMTRSLDEANFSNRVYHFSYSSSEDFGRPGWGRTYPMPWGESYDG